jgi:hypothetical protein
VPPSPRTAMTATGPAASDLPTCRSIARRPTKGGVAGWQVRGGRTLGLGGKALVANPKHESCHEEYAGRAPGPPRVGGHTLRPSWQGIGGQVGRDGAESEHEVAQPGEPVMASTGQAWVAAHGSTSCRPGAVGGSACPCQLVPLLQRFDWLVRPAVSAVGDWCGARIRTCTIRGSWYSSREVRGSTTKHEKWTLNMDVIRTVIASTRHPRQNRRRRRRP